MQGTSGATRPGTKASWAHPSFTPSAWKGSSAEVTSPNWTSPLMPSLWGMGRGLVSD